MIKGVMKVNIDIYDIPGYSDKRVNIPSADILKVMSLQPYDAISFPCTTAHQYGVTKRCKQQAQVKVKTRKHFDREMVLEHGRPWPSGSSPIWAECRDKTIYVFRKPWGSKLGNSAHPIDYAKERARWEEYAKQPAQHVGFGTYVKARYD